MAEEHQGSHCGWEVLLTWRLQGVKSLAPPGQERRLTPVIPAFWEAEVGRLPENTKGRGQGAILSGLYQLRIGLGEHQGPYSPRSRDPPRMHTSWVTPFCHNRAPVIKKDSKTHLLVVPCSTLLQCTNFVTLKTCSGAWWLTPVIPALCEAKAGGSPEVRRLRPAGQHGEILSLQKIQKLAVYSGMHLQSQLLGRLRQENHLNLGGRGCTTREAEAGESLEPESRRLQRAEITPLHASLDEKSETLSQKKKKKKKKKTQSGSVAQAGVQWHDHGSLCSSHLAQQDCALLAERKLISALKLTSIYTFSFSKCRRRGGGKSGGQWESQFLSGF
ncbi:LOW QUALITY PROTEIN: hypothetical protein AAY473_035814 [Plecturocebus cupreus]